MSDKLTEAKFLFNEAFALLERINTLLLEARKAHEAEVARRAYDEGKYHPLAPFGDSVRPCATAEDLEALRKKYDDASKTRPEPFPRPSVAQWPGAIPMVSF